MKTPMQELLEWAEREKKHCTTSIKKSTFKSDLCVIGAVQAYKNIISHLTQPKEGESFNPLPDHPEKD